MKKVIVPMLMGMGIICSVPKAAAQEFTEHLTRDFLISPVTESAVLYIYNINGFIKVEGYSGDKVVLEMDKIISADDGRNLETGKKEFQLAFDRKTDTIIAYIAAPYDSRPHRKWNYNDDRKEIEYDYKVNFTVKVPFAMNLHISTVNDGIISVNNVSGTLNVSNVNDAITITNARGTSSVRTVNGDLSVSYLTNPSGESSYNTINGNIRVSYQKDLSADLQFKSMHGDFFTDFPDAVLLPASVDKVKEKNSKGTVYKLNATTSVRFGKGGKRFRFETLNGNIYIKKQS